MEGIDFLYRCSFPAFSLVDCFPFGKHKENRERERERERERRSERDRGSRIRRTVFPEPCRKFALAEAVRVLMVRHRLNTKYLANGTRGWSRYFQGDVHQRKMIGPRLETRRVLAIKWSYRDELARRFDSSDF